MGRSVGSGRGAKDRHLRDPARTMRVRDAVRPEARYGPGSRSAFDNSSKVACPDLPTSGDAGSPDTRRRSGGRGNLARRQSPQGSAWRATSSDGRTEWSPEKALKYGWWFVPTDAVR